MGRELIFLLLSMRLHSSRLLFDHQMILYFSLWIMFCEFSAPCLRRKPSGARFRQIQNFIYQTWSTCVGWQLWASGDFWDGVSFRWICMQLTFLLHPRWHHLTVYVYSSRRCPFPIKNLYKRPFQTVIFFFWIVFAIWKNSNINKKVAVSETIWFPLHHTRLCPTRDVSHCGLMSFSRLFFYLKKATATFFTISKPDNKPGFVRKFYAPRLWRQHSCSSRSMSPN